MMHLLPNATQAPAAPGHGDGAPLHERVSPSSSGRVSHEARCLVALRACVPDTRGMALLERESSLASLAEYAEEARRGEGRLVFVAGEAGVGKSALVEQFAGDAPGTRWSWGACDGLFTPRPLGPLFDIADQLGGELLDLCRARAPRDELFAALLRQAGDPDTLHVVVIEDLHWADEATIDLLRFLGRRVRNAAMLLIGTYRDDDAEASDPLRLALGELARQRSTRRIVLAPLSADAVSVLAAGSGLETAALFRLTGGNPFYVCEVVQAGMEQVPASARDAVLARVVSLSRESRELLDAAALSGARVELRLLEAVMPGWPSAIDELTASGLLAGDGSWLKFRHEIARLASSRRSPHTAAAPSTPGFFLLCILWTATTMHAWPFTPRGPRMARQSCVTRRPPPAARRNWVRTAKQRSSSSVRSGSRHRRIRPPSPDCTTSSLTR